MTSSQMITMAEIIGPLLKRGQSVYQIIENHPELGICVKTLYTYIESGIFKDYGIDNFSLRRQVAMKKQKVLKPRRQPACYDGHKYDDFLEFRESHPDIPVTEMDTLYKLFIKIYYFVSLLIVSLLGERKRINYFGKVYAHILDEDRKVNAQKFGSAFYSNPDLRKSGPPAEPEQPKPLDVAALIEQLQKSPELASTLAALIAGQGV